MKTAEKMKIIHDIHIHTNLSFCAAHDATLEKYVQQAKGGQLKVLGISNHLWDSDVPGASQWYVPQNVDHVLQLKKLFPSNREIEGIKILFGCETEFTYEGKLCITEEHMALFDYILVPHSHTHIKVVMPQEYAGDHSVHARFLMDSFMRVVTHRLSRHFTAIAHPFFPGTNHNICNTVQALIPNSYFYEAFAAAREADVAIEINGSCLPKNEIPNCEYVRIYSIAKECGCRFTYGSDSHDHRVDRKLHLVEFFCDQCGITQEDFLSVKDLVAKIK